MPSTSRHLAPIALLLSAAAGGMTPAGAPVVADGMEAQRLEDQWSAARIPTGAPMLDTAMEPGGFSGFVAGGLANNAWNQVRIEQRMIIRIAPRLPGQFMAMPQRPPAEPRFLERKTAKCLPVSSIAGVQPESAGRILLITRNRKLIGASLDKSCRARDFYSGFYVEQSVDGQLCAGRDIIHSRAGANCAVTKLRELVPDDDED